MNYLWGGMIITGVITAALTGNLGEVSEQALSSAKEAVSLCITMAGVMAFWSGIMRVAELGGLLARAAKALDPVISLLFPSVPKKGEARTQIAVNMAANILGLGWASTPAGLNAMKELKSLEPDEGRATDAMCDFLILNISSLQLIPVNIIAYRSQYGSVNPTAIVGPAILATAASTGTAVVFILVRRILAGKKVRRRL